MKLAILNDTHVGVRNSSEIFIDYQERFYTEVFFPYLLENNITKIIHLGDYYEQRRFVNFKALKANRLHFLEKLREYGITMDIIPGNHDVYYKNTNDLCSLNELLGHYMNEVNIIAKPIVENYDGLDIALIPWINPENIDETVDFIKGCDARYLGGHLEFEGFQLMPGVTNTHGILPHKVFNRFEEVWSGHFHMGSQKDNIRYLGSQMEFTWSDVDQKKYFHVFDTDTLEMTPVLNPITIFAKIFYNDSDTDYRVKDISYLDRKFVKLVVVEKNNAKMFDDFVERIQNRNIYELKIAENFDTIGSVSDEDVSVENTESLLSSYCDNLETTLDTDRLKQQLIDLMIESQNMEFV
jgi:DNA repair exonuclease SbcCD nuclease subunit